ncbi:MAG: hypothetical protein K0S33_292 [Bacteroidetes bacterium]|jgi:hypothetical protein|nr:hypothetical protein [Bacteroidota bacterium]
MKKYTIVSAVMAMVGSLAFGQASLPTSEDFNAFTGTFSQAGWTYVENPAFTPNFSYTSGGVSGTAMGRLDETMDYIEVFVGGQMGASTFYLKGQGSPAPWQGTFTVLESVNGSAWTNLMLFNAGNPMPVALTQFTVTPAAASRYIRFEFTNKVSGYNVAIDNVNITAGVPVTQDINVKYNTTTVLTGGTTPIFGSAVGTPLALNFSVENIGLATLNVASAILSGPDAADFVVTSPVGAFAVAGAANQALVITFTPSASGTRMADLTIASDDADEAAYVIHLYGVGGTLATEPADQASNLNFSNVKSYRANYAFSAATGSPEGYIILRKTGASAITDIPADGTWYDKGDQIGASKVYYTGNDLNGCLMNVWAGQTYQLAIFTYNGNGTYTNYNTTAPLTGNVTSLATMMPAGEYTGISTASATFLTDLSAHINPHSSIFYSNYTNTMINLFEARDTADNKKFVVCRYSDYKAVYTPPFDYTGNDFSREHSYCHNWMPTNPADNPEKPEYNDQHHLFPCKQEDVNAERSNYPLGEVVTIQNQFMLGKSGLDAAGHKVYEPKDEHKGNAARAIMYVATCYNGISGNNWKFRDPISPSIQYGQDQTVLKMWHYLDPPDAYEIARNDFLDSLQGNRNPFIDSMQYACYIDFYTMTKINSPTIPCNISEVGVKEKYDVEFDYSLFPNPSNGTFSVLLNAANAEVFTVNVIDVTGRVIETRVVNGKQGNNYISFEKNTLPAGAYMIETTTGKDKLVKKLIVQ